MMFSCTIERRNFFYTALDILDQRIIRLDTIALNINISFGNAFDIIHAFCARIGARCLSDIDGIATNCGFYELFDTYFVYIKLLNELGTLPPVCVQSCCVQQYPVIDLIDDTTDDDADFEPIDTYREEQESSDSDEPGPQFCLLIPDHIRYTIQDLISSEFFTWFGQLLISFDVGRAEMGTSFSQDDYWFTIDRFLQDWFPEARANVRLELNSKLFFMLEHIHFCISDVEEFVNSRCYRRSFFRFINLRNVHMFVSSFRQIIMDLAFHKNNYS